MSVVPKVTNKTKRSKVGMECMSSYVCYSVFMVLRVSVTQLQPWDWGMINLLTSHVFFVARWKKLHIYIHTHKLTKR